MRESKEQTSRIQLMERRLVAATAAVKRLDAVLDELETIKEDIAALNAYYGSDEWRQDLADDEAGQLPAGLKRGVLSEDGIWNLLEAWREAEARLRGAAR